MTTALYPALFFTVALLVTSAYFLLGGLPLLILKHDTPLDSRFVRGFFDTYYLAAMITAGGTAVSYIFTQRYQIVVVAAAIAMTAALLRRQVLDKMDRHRAEIETDNNAVQRFRGVQIAATVLCFLQLVLVVWSLLSFAK